MSTKLIIAVIVIAALFAGTAFLAGHFKEIGYATCKTERDQALAKTQEELTKLRAEHAAEQEQHQRELVAARAEARRAVVKDPAAAAWWVVPVPAAVVDYVYGRVRLEGGEGAVWP